MKRVTDGMWYLAYSGVSYLDCVAVNHNAQIIDTWQKAKKYFSQWHYGKFILIWDNNKSFKCYNINIK